MEGKQILFGFFFGGSGLVFFDILVRTGTGYTCESVKQLLRNVHLC